MTIISVTYRPTKKQEAALHRLERALQSCEQEGLFIWSDCGTVSAVNGNIADTVAPDSTIGDEIDYNLVATVLSVDIREFSDGTLYVKLKETL